MIDALPLADLGVKGLYLLFLWLAGCIGGAWLSDRKGYGERAGLTTGLLGGALITPLGLAIGGAGLFLTLIAIPIWLVWPARASSTWKREGARPKRHAPPEVPPAAGDGESGAAPRAGP